MRGGTEIPSNSNLNTYLTPGNYFCSSNNVANTINGSPFTHAFTMKVEFSQGTGYPRQTVRDFYNGQTATRVYNINGNYTWTDWVYFSDDATIFAGTAIQSGDDLNDYATPGIYRSGSSTVTASLLNMPEMFGSGFSLLVLPISTVTNIQIILPSANGSRFYYRGSTTSGWNESWYQYIGTQIS